MGKASVSDLSEGVFTGACEIKSAIFEKSNFGGKFKGKPITALNLTVQSSEDGEASVFLPVNGFGKEDWQPSEDGNKPSKKGNFLAPSKKDARISSGVNFGKFLTTLVAKGFKQEEIDASEYEGLKIVLGRIAAATKESPDRQLYVVEEILEDLPWESGGGKKSKSKKKDEDEEEEEAEDEDSDDEEAEEEEEEESDDEDADDSDSDDEEEEASADDPKVLNGVMEAVLEANKKGILRKDVQKAVYTVLPKHNKKLVPQRKAIADACADAEYLGSKIAKKVLSFDSKTGKITAA